MSDAERDLVRHRPLSGGPDGKPGVQRDRVAVARAEPTKAEVRESVTAPALGVPAASKLAYTIAEVAELLGLCRATIYKLIGEGQLRTIYLSERAPRVLHEDVVAFLQRKRDEAVERSEFIRSRLGARF